MNKNRVAEEAVMPRKQQSRKLTLTQKLILSYAAMAFFTMGALMYAVMGLYSMHNTARTIAGKDLFLISAAEKLRVSILTQQKNVRKYAILGDHEYVDIYRRQEAEFLAQLRQAQQRKPGPELTFLGNVYQNYQATAERLFEGDLNSDASLRAASQKVLEAIDRFAANQRRQLSYRLEEADRQEETTIRWTLTLSFIGFFLALSVAGFSVYTISRAIAKLKRATHRIAEGDFDHDPLIPTGDELGDLAQDFSHMAGRLKVLEQMSLDASPLTRLPGNIAIERALTRRVDTGESFALCYADLDNFKAYNDRYGYIKASEIIQLTGKIIFEAIKEHGDSDSFVGHVGGDDFVMIVSPDQSATVCDAVIKGFDEMILAHYSPEDLDRGAIDGVDRYGVPRIFPIMTISIAVLVCDKGEYDSAIEIAKAAAEIKDHVKEFPGSNYLVNRRNSDSKSKMKQLLATIILAVQLTGCAALQKPGGLLYGHGQEQKLTAAVQQLRDGNPKTATSLLAAICAEPGAAGVTDEALFRLGLLYLRTPSESNDTPLAQHTFERLQREYPASPWTRQAAPLIRLLSTTNETQRQNHSLKALNLSLTRENRELRQSMEKLKHLDMELENKNKQ
jgi:diguanylate cyclase (GGDEF)-like protein